MSGQGTPRPWYVGRDYYGGVSIRTTPDDASNIDGRNVVSENTGRGAGDMEEEDAILIVAAVNACDRLAPGLPPDKLEEYVLALVREAGEAERFLREVSPLLREANRDVGAVMIAQVLELALAPFAHLGGEP